MQRLSILRYLSLFFATVLPASLGIYAHSQTPSIDIPTWQVDTKHTGVNANETVLNPVLITTPGDFAPIFSEQVDGQVFAQPLYLSGATTSQFAGAWSDGLTHGNVVFVVTQNATLYAFDADRDPKYQKGKGTSNPIWSLHLVPANNTTAVAIPNQDANSGTDIFPLLGVTATPVIDTKNGIIYVVSALKDTSDPTLVNNSDPNKSHPYEQLLWAINVKSGKPVLAPVKINPVFNGQSVADTNPPCSNDPSVGGCENDNEPAPAPGKIPFYPLHSHLRTALTLDNFNGHNTLYLAYASHSDIHPYSGFVVGYDATTLQQTSDFTTTPDDSDNEAGIWMSGASPAIDPALNRMYVTTGNGAKWHDPNTNSFSLGTNWPMSVLAFDTTPAGSQVVNGLNELQVPFADTTRWFTPTQWDNFNNGDHDLGSGGPLLFDLPAPDGSTKQLLLAGGKAGVMFLLDRTNLNGMDTKDGTPVSDPNDPNFDTFENGNVVQQLNLSTGSIFSTPVLFNGKIYFTGGNFGVSSLPVGFSQTTTNYIGTTEDDSPEGKSGKGAGIFISANGTSNGLVWQVENGIRAWDASKLSKPAIYNSTALTDDAEQLPCDTTAFALPIVSGGKVYFTCYQAPSGNTPQDNKPGYLWIYGPPQVATGAPAQIPQSLSAQADSQSQITLTWTDSETGTTAPTSFNIFRATCSSCEFDLIETTSNTKFVDTGLDNDPKLLATNPNPPALTALNPSTTYFYKVFATNNAGPSNSSNIASATTLQAFSQPGLVAYWPFDEGVQQGLSATSSIDLTGNGNTAVKDPDPTNELQSSSTGYIGGSWNYHGTTIDDRLVVKDSRSLEFTANQSFSLVAWVNPQTLVGSAGVGTPNGLDGASLIVKSRDQGGEYGLWINLNGQWEARSGVPGAPGTILTGSAATTNVWTQLALVQDGPNNKRYFYVNGQVVNQGKAQDASGGGDLWFGQQNLPDPDQQDGFQGFIDEVRIYNTVVTPAQLASDISDPVYLATSIQNHAGTPVGLQLYPFGIDGFPTTETRVAANQTYTLQLNFAQPLSATPTAVLNAQPGSTQPVQGGISSATLDPSGMLLTVTLANVANGQALQLHLSGLSSGASLNGTYDLPFNVLEGDITSDGVVDSADTAAIATLIANNNNNPITSITPANAQFDLNLDGVVNSQDQTAATNLVGVALPLQTDVDLALFKQTSTSGGINNGNLAAFAVDNTLATRWESIQGVDPQAISIDLNKVANIDSIILNWENAAGANYLLQTSNNSAAFNEQPASDCTSANWTTIENVVGNQSGGVKTYNSNAFLVPAAGTARYVRMCGTTRVTTFGYSLLDFEVIGSFPPAGTTAPVITSAPSETGIVGTTIAPYTVTSNQAGTTFTITGTLPPGVTFDGVATISGTPTATGPFPITLTATNPTGQTSRATLTLTINAPTPVFTSSLSPAATVGVNFPYTITATPAGTTFTITGTLPPGVTFDGVATISGIPAASGSFPITLTATNSTGQRATATLILTVNPATVQPPPPPAPPTGVTLTAISSSQVTVNWTASTSQGVTYSIFRSTTPNFNPAGLNPITGASNLSTLTFTDSGLTAATQYFYIVEAINIAQVATTSAQASITTPATTDPSPFTEIVAINAGSSMPVSNSGSTVTFRADTNFVTGNGTDTVQNTINTTGVLGAAPAAVYQTASQGAVTYTIPSSYLTAGPGQTYTVVLHFAELFFQQPNQRQFNVSINQKQVLQNFDIVAEAGNANFTAVVATIPNITPQNGQIIITFSGGAADQPMVNGIEIQTGGAPIPSAPTALTASTVSTNQINLNWTASISSDVTYNVYRSTTPGFIPTAATTPLANVQGTSFSDTQQLTPRTQYYYVVESVTGAGVSSPRSQHATNITLTASNDAIAINAGSPMVVQQFLGDTDFVGGGVDAPNQTITIPATVQNPAPQQVYQSARQGNVIYTIPSSILTPGKNYTVLLHFAELFFNLPSKRVFSITINGQVVSPTGGFDIFSAANNAEFTAVDLTYPNITPDPTTNQIVIAFTGITDQPMVNGIEIIPQP